jgi:putative transposase
MNIVNPSKEYHSDSGFVYSCQYHVIFCPKYRRSVLKGKISERFQQLVTEKQNEYGYFVVEQEVMPDHVHLLLDVNPKNGIYTIVSKIKGYTSHQLRQEFPELVSKLPTLWSSSRFISTVGAVTLEVVKKYIEAQKGK